MEPVLQSKLPSVKDNRHCIIKIVLFWLRMTKEDFYPEFIPVFHSSLADGNLNKQDVLVLGVVYWFERLKEGKCFASNATLARIIGSKNPTSISNSLKRLEENGYIQCIFFDESKRHRKEIVCFIHKLNKGVFHPQMKGVSSTDERRVSSTDEQSENTVRKNIKKNTDELINLFQEINPSYRLLFSRPPQRAAAERLLKLHPLDWWTRFMPAYLEAMNDRYCPKATTPVQMEEKIGAIEIYGRAKKHEQLSKSNIVI